MPVERILVASDGTETAERAVRFAADMAGRYGAELVVLHVLVPGAAAPRLPGGEPGRVRVVTSSDPARAILDTADEEAADVIVVGNVGMRGGRRLLPGNVPNQVSHGARCTVVLVDTDESPRRRGLLPRRG